MENKIIKFLAHNGKVSVKCIDSTKIVEDARKIHDNDKLDGSRFKGRRRFYNYSNKG